MLVLGESHHSREHPVGSVVPNLTHQVMQAYAETQERGAWMRTLDNFAWALSGKSRWQLASAVHRGEFDVWRSVAFYNYIPVVLAESSRKDRPSTDHYLQAQEPFRRVLDQLKPELVLVWGYELFPRILAGHWKHSVEKPWSFSGDFVDVCDPHRLRLVRMLHPSTGFSHTRWHAVISDAVVSF